MIAGAASVRRVLARPRDASAAVSPAVHLSALDHLRPQENGLMSSAPGIGHTSLSGSVPWLSVPGLAAAASILAVLAMPAQTQEQARSSRALLPAETPNSKNLRAFADTPHWSAIGLPPKPALRLASASRPGRGDHPLGLGGPPPKRLKGGSRWQPFSRIDPGAPMRTAEVPPRATTSA